ncbi:hypothetical protein K458DRAFT_490601 [Lentithecium fluviatile CBS 122367]|uniref:CoA-dependent acyltransferase n=1 Tax=Lentithecium fluviatile CBS 122367 TaxID=1168545 RepID=A0A6G1IMS4_9PLEO|nr:hypothetical protein K458DRAFT_490601 [Lentithecium fluviatile CBS 122367]
MSPWTASGPKTFVRPLGENEIFIKMVNDPYPHPDMEHWAINSTATIELGDGLPPSKFEAQLRHAWGHLRFQHPSLAARIAEDQISLVYEVPEPKDFENWISRTFIVARDAASAAEFMHTLKPSPYASLIYVPKTCEVLGHTSHWRSDGFGVFHLLNDLLNLVVKDDLTDPTSLPWGAEVVRLAPTIEDAAGLSPTATEEQSTLGKSLVQTFISTAGGIGIQYMGDASTPPGRTVSTQAVLSTKTTKDVVDACKSRGLTVTSAAHASVAAANWALAGSDRAKTHYTSTIRWSLRRFLPSQFSGPSYASAIATTGWMDKVEEGKEWSDYAEHYNALYRNSLSKEYVDAHRAYAVRLVALVKSLPPNLPIQSDVDISSMGIVEALIKRTYGSRDNSIAVTAISLGIENLSRQGSCYVWTFRDQLNLRVIYNEAYHEREKMERFIRTVKESLLGGLGVVES